MLVQKYGGSSVGTPEKIKGVAARIAHARRHGEDVVVVVSAMGDTTDELLALANQVTTRRPQSHERELDVLLSAGERISMALLSIALRDLGQEAISFTGSQAGIITDESHTRARILEIRPIRVKEELARGKVVIVAGFQGVSRTKEITTLGRGGSDTTAVAMAVALGASRCEVFTDVPGIFSGDPRLIPNARRYERLPLILVLEMAATGAQVMHARSIEIARSQGLPIFVGMAHAKGMEGTLLMPDQNMPSFELPKVVAITSRASVKVLCFDPERAEGLLAELAANAALVQGLAWGAGGVTLLIDTTDDGGVLEKHPESVMPGLFACVTVVGFQLQQNTKIPAQIVDILRAESIPVAGLTCHPNSITVWFPETKDACARAVKRLHAALVST